MQTLESLKESLQKIDGVIEAVIEYGKELPTENLSGFDIDLCGVVTVITIKCKSADLNRVRLDSGEIIQDSGWSGALVNVTPTERQRYFLGELVYKFQRMPLYSS